MKLFFLFLSIIFLYPGWIVEAQTRRALLIGINNYKPKEAPKSQCRNEWWNLRGCVNDVEAMKAVMESSRFGFKPGNIYVLKNEQATKERILSDFKKYLIDSASAGDICVFYYSGHGSRVKNSMSDEPDKMDETLVPADWYRGVGDIRDKELKKLFNRVLDKQAHLTVIIDACHSGSISRGISVPSRFRSLPADPCDIAQPPDKEKSPAERGALIFSAARDFQGAVETLDENNHWHGLFTWALLKVLKSIHGTGPAQNILLKVKAIMQSERPSREPNLEGLPARTKKSIFGIKTYGALGSLRVAVLQVKRQLVELQGGLALGIREGCEFKTRGERVLEKGSFPVSYQPSNDGKANARRAIKSFDQTFSKGGWHPQPIRPPAGPPEATSQNNIRVRVTAVHGLSRCTARVIKGDVKRIKVGDLFELDKWVAAREARMQVRVPVSHYSHDRLTSIVRKIAGIRESPDIHWVEDPTVISPTHIISWFQSYWKLQNLTGSGNPIVKLGENPREDKILEEVLKNHSDPNTKPRVFLQLPLSTQLYRTVRMDINDYNHSINISSKEEGIHYILVGRFVGGEIQYAWVLPDMTQAGGQDFALPIRTGWIAAGESDIRFQELAEELTDRILQLVRIRAWLQLSSPPDNGRFPYHLALKNAETGEITTTGPLTKGETYGLILKADEAKHKALVSCQPSNDGKANARRAIKSFDQTFSKVWPPAGPPEATHQTICDATLDGVEKRYVYVFSIDSSGKGTLLFPGRVSRNTENCFPSLPGGDEDDFSTEGKKNLSCEIKLGNKRSFRIKEPFGVDTFILLTSTDAISHPWVLDFEGVRRKKPAGRLSPFEELLYDLSSVSRNEMGRPMRINWSIQRLSIVSKQEK